MHETSPDRPLRAHTGQSGVYTHRMNPVTSYCSSDVILWHGVRLEDARRCESEGGPCRVTEPRLSMWSSSASLLLDRVSCIYMSDLNTVQSYSLSDQSNKLGCCLDHYGVVHHGPLVLFLLTIWNTFDRPSLTSFLFHRILTPKRTRMDQDKRGTTPSRTYLTSASEFVREICVCRILRKEW